MIAGLCNPMMGAVSAQLLLLDLTTHVPARAYSTRKLSASYDGPILKVRRSSDNVELDIYSDGQDLDVGALTSFIGGGDGFITKMYDQSGNGQDATQTNNSDQKRIAVSGVVQLMGLKPSVVGSGGSYMNFPLVSDTRTLISVFKPSSFTAYNSYFGNSATAPFHGDVGGARVLRSGGSVPETFNGLWRVNGASAQILEYVINVNNSYVVNCITTGNIGVNQWSKDRGYSDRTLKGHAPELVVWSVDVGADTLVLEQNQLAYWGV